jgi:hypothetical protein
MELAKAEASVWISTNERDDIALLVLRKEIEVERAGDSS